MTTNFRIRCVTWNAGEAPPPKDFTDLLSLDAEVLPNLYAIGFQELPASTRDLIASTVYDDDWTMGLTEALAKKDYVRVKSVRMVGISLLVFVQRQDLHYVMNIESEKTPTGIGGVWGNKGGVSIRMNISGVDMCFVNCHLMPHMPNTAGRILHYNEVLDSQTFRDPGCPNILDHDYVFWIGDLNFRLDEIPNDEVKKRIQEGDLEYLLQYDQLRKAMKEGVILVDFQEGPLSFAPTYKFDFGTDTYDTSAKQRKPGWCDRILWLAHEDAFEGTELAVDQLSYTSLPQYLDSDHKPVVADFNVKVLRLPQELPVMFEPLEKWVGSDGGRCVYTVTSDLPVSSWDWIGLYKADFKHPLDYVTYVWASTRGESLHDGSQMYKLKVDHAYLDNTVGEYCLCYFSKTKNCLMGYSDVFRICLVEESSSESSNDESSDDYGSFSPEGGARPKTSTRRRQPIK